MFSRAELTTQTEHTHTISHILITLQFIMCVMLSGSVYLKEQIVRLYMCTISSLYFVPPYT